ncbi:MAG: carbamoyltransferase, partial [Alphaproteobacteria bacterium]|nr:carbamoyltransferase [Alphaproteobacteria bacterium]
MTAILGLNAHHADAAACLIVDGRVVAAAEEERFTRVKHWAGVPERAARFCLDWAGLEPGQLDVIAVNADHRANRGVKLAALLRW